MRKEKIVPSESWNILVLFKLNVFKLKLRDVIQYEKTYNISTLANFEIWSCNSPVNWLLFRYLYIKIITSIITKEIYINHGLRNERGLVSTYKLRREGKPSPFSIKSLIVPVKWLLLTSLKVGTSITHQWTSYSRLHSEKKRRQEGR